MDTNEIILISDSEESVDSVIVCKVPSKNTVSKGTNTEEEDVVTLSSISQRSTEQSTERCPVTWPGKKPKAQFFNGDTFCTPSPRTKVSNWLSEISERYSQIQILQKGSEESLSTSKSSILVRQDYKKPSSNPETSPQSKIVHLESKSDSNLTTKHVVGDMIVYSTKESGPGPNNSETRSSLSAEALRSQKATSEPPQSTTKPSEHALNSLEPNNEAQKRPKTPTKDKRKFKPFDNIPLSPESQKKIELCKYLKLMNPADVHSIEMHQNRRSMRVKYLALMSEKKELEQKLNCTDEKKPQKKAEESKSSKKITSPLSSRRSSVKTPSKFLQVPEVSTTSKIRLEQSKDAPKPDNAHKSDEMDTSSCKSESFTKRSFEQLNMSVENIMPPLKKICSESTDVGFLTESVKNVPNPVSDFEETMREVLKQDEFRRLVLEKLKKAKKKRKKKSEITALLNSSSGRPHTRHMHRRGRSGKYIHSVMPLHKKRANQVKHKKRPRKRPSSLNLQDKEFRTAELIQHAPDTPKTATSHSEEAKCSPIKKRLPEAEVWKKYFTTEHRKAYIESLKYLEGGEPSPKTEKTPQPELVKADPPDEPETQKKTDEKHRPSTEDLEVDLLMRKMEQKVQTDKTPPVQEKCGSPMQDSTCTNQSIHSSHSNSMLSSPQTLSSWSRQSQGEKHKTPVSLHSPAEDLAPTPSETTHHSSPQQPEIVNVSQIQPVSCKNIQHAANGVQRKSLHSFLTQPKRLKEPPPCEDSAESAKNERRALQSHSIYLSTANGALINAYYMDYNLVTVQELVIGFWTQSPLGNVLGAQDMWIPKGTTQRMVLGSGCVQKESCETMISVEGAIAYVELWTKEHLSDKRERPVADIFVAIYPCISRNGPEKKVLQLENIHGYAADVQYIVINNSRNIVVSWSICNEGVSSTLIHLYQLSPDYQMVTSITKMQTVSHYISSLHNIEDCDTLILGSGDNKVTLWDLQDGNTVATIDLINIQPEPKVVWAKRDRGFLFTLHHFSEGTLQLIAINSFDSTWKRLQTYKPEFDYESLLGVYMKNGLLIAFYDTGISCWNAQIGLPIMDDTSEDGDVLLPCGKHVVVISNNQVHVRHALEYLVANFPNE